MQLMRSLVRVTPLLVSVLVGPTAASIAAQSFQNTPAHIPSGAFNSGATENVDFADIDGDGDRDMVKADGGDYGNDQNRLWVNTGGEPTGTLGWFADRTATQLPAVLDTSRDMDFADVDGDGDQDIYVSNTSSWVNQSCRWWINMGGAQSGTPGYFQDQTATRWTFIAVNDGVSHFSSIALSVKLASGGFVDWVCDAALGDLDNDGDPDLIHTSYGGTFTGIAPSRLFLNDGFGAFEEFNPSHFQLSSWMIQNGDPGLWCQGLQLQSTTNTTGANCDIADTPLGVELGDLDGDFDLDFLQGSRNTMPRTYRNRLTDTGAFTTFRDVTFAAGYTAAVTGAGHYEQELGDFDNDGDLDLYGVDWPAFNDCTLRNSGAGVFGSQVNLAGSASADNEADWLDYDNDGRLDVFVGTAAGQSRLYRGVGAPNWTFTNVTAGQLPSLLQSLVLGEDSCDVDNDGDYDLMLANDAGFAENLLVNVNQVPDTTAPRLGPLEQAPPRAAGPTPTVVRVDVYDNSSWDVMRYDALSLEHSWDGVNWYSSPMRYAGGQMFRGTIRGDIAGTIQYRARGVDEHGNVGLSTIQSYLSSGCTGNLVNYCTAGTTSHGCVSVISGSGTPSAVAVSGFTINVTSTEGQRQGLIFYGVSGRIANAWGAGSTSFVCVKAPTQRTPAQTSTGTSNTCNGTFTLDFNAYRAAHPTALGSPFSAGQVLDAQCWFRDPPAPKTTNLSGGLEFTLCP